MLTLSPEDLTLPMPYTSVSLLSYVALIESIDPKRIDMNISKETHHSISKQPHKMN